MVGILQVRAIEDVGGKTFCFEVYNDKNEIVKATKKDSKGTAVAGNHTRYRLAGTSTCYITVAKKLHLGSESCLPLVSGVACKNIATIGQLLLATLTRLQ